MENWLKEGFVFVRTNCRLSFSASFLCMKQCEVVSLLHYRDDVSACHVSADMCGHVRSLLRLTPFCRCSWTMTLDTFTHTHVSCISSQNAYTNAHKESEETSQEFCTSTITVDMGRKTIESNERE